MIILEKKGDITECDADVIVCHYDCLSVKTRGGLDEYISDKLKVNPYSKRKCAPTEKNLALRNDRGVPGTCILVPNPNLTVCPPKHVACLLTQFAPDGWTQVYPHIIRYHGHRDDSYERRLWFSQALNSLRKQMIQLRLRHVVFPKYCGCDSDQAQWFMFYDLIHGWSQTCPFDVYLVDHQAKPDLLKQQ